MENENEINGAIIEEENLLDSFKKALEIKEEVGGRFALIPDLLNAKSNLVNLNYKGEKVIYGDLDNTVTPSVIFYGKTRENTPILIINNNIEEMFKKNPIILERSKLYTNENIENCNHKEIRLIPEEFWKLESGNYGKISIIDYVSYAKQIKEMDIDDNYRSSIGSISLSLEEAMNDEVIKALIPKKRESILDKLLKITEETITNENTVKEYKNLIKDNKNRNDFLKIIYLKSLLLYSGHYLYETDDDLCYTGRLIGLHKQKSQSLSYHDNFDNFKRYFCHVGFLETNALPFNIDFDKGISNKDSFVVVKDEKLLENTITTNKQYAQTLNKQKCVTTNNRLIRQWAKEKEAKYKGTK